MNNDFSALFPIDRWVTDMLQLLGLSGEMLYFSRAGVFILLLILLASVVNWIVKNIILVMVWKFTAKTNNQWIKTFSNKRIFKKLSHVAPVIIIYLFGPLILVDYPRLADLTYLVTNIYLVVVGWMVVFAVINAFTDIYQTFDIAKTRPVKGYVQILKIFFSIIGGILVLSLLLGRSPIVFITGLGAMTAVLMLVFRDTILGFVGGVQVTANDLVQIGDWIEMPKYRADGDVTDIRLHTVIVQNWDRTISIIPTYALVSEGFVNWRGMIRSGGRRIKRSVYVDMKSIKFCDEEMLARFEQVHYLKDYIRKRRQEIEEYNKKHDFDGSQPVNGRRMTNVGTFRAYITNYLANHPLIKKDMLYMVRQLQPNEKGLPMEIYAFASSVEWIHYERIQADIFDHIFSVTTFFELKIFQHPSELNVDLSNKPISGEVDKQ